MYMLLVYSTIQHVHMWYVHRKQKHGDKLRDSTRCRGVPEAGSPMTRTLGENWGHRCEPSRMGTRSPRRVALLPSPVSSTGSQEQRTTATLPRRPGRALGTPSRPHPSVQDVNRQDRGKMLQLSGLARPPLISLCPGFHLRTGAGTGRALPTWTEHILQEGNT